MHPSLLPRWRGAAPIERAIEAGDEATGVTIIKPTAEFDAGPMYLQRRRADPPRRQLREPGARLAALGGDLLVKTLDTRPPSREQPDEGVTYADKIYGGGPPARPGLPAAELTRRVRAFTPHIGALVELPGGSAWGWSRAARPRTAPAPGELGVGDGRLLYGAADGALELLEVHPPGKRSMEAAA